MSSALSDKEPVLEGLPTAASSSQDHLSADDCQLASTLSPSKPQKSPFRKPASNISVSKPAPQHELSSQADSDDQPSTLAPVLSSRSRKRRLPRRAQPAQMQHQDPAASKHAVFVYGSLLPGLHNAYLLKGAKLEQYCTTQPEFEMWSMGSYPGVCHGGSGGGSVAIRGAVFLVDDHMLSRLDQLEQHPNWYCRELVQLPQRKQPAWMYILPKSEVIGLSKVENGDWSSYFCQQPASGGM